ncbi:VOC family protein [Caulobacter sp. DWP3-1-3b2]|uniref:VOC family protein n=1 Tax=Caulobacter sp. DWP3-1-3b2 TaxID=2804643 RepID=UPI003CF56E45
MTQLTGVHHIAVMATDVKKHIAFFSEVLGCPLVALFDMHGVDGGLHAFLRLNDHSYFSIVQLPGVAAAPIEIGKTHAGSGAGVSAAGTLQHLAFNVDTPEAMLAMRDRIRDQGVNVIGPIDHGFCQSIYFAGPDHMTLEIATGQNAVDPRQWIDPKTMAAAAISAEEAEIFKNPVAYVGPSPVPQPPYDPGRPHQTFPEAVYRKMLELPDEVISARSSHAEPPVKVQA